MDRKRIGKSARNKGAGAERELANLIRDTWGYQTRRGYVFEHQSDVIGLPGIHMEVKRVEKLNVRAAMDQAKRESQIRCDGIPVVFHRKNYGKWKVTMELGDLVELLGYTGCIDNTLATVSLADWIDIYGGWINESMQHDS